MCRLRGAIFAFVVVTLAVIAPPVHLQEAQREKIDVDVVEQIRDEGLNRSHIPENARYLMDVIGPRLTGSPAMKRANEWTAQKMREYGLENVHLEAYEFGRGWEEVSYFGRMTEPFVRPLSGRSLAWTGSTKGLQSGPAVIVKAESEADLAKYQGELNGAWILMDEAGEPRNPSFDPVPLRWSLEELLAPPRPSWQEPVGLTEERRRRRIERFQRQLAVQIKLRESDALGVLWRSSRMDGVIRGSSILGDIAGSLLNPGGPHILPNIMLSDEDYSLIYRNAARDIPVALEFNIQNRSLEGDPTAYNSIGEILGTDKRDEVVMLGAHLDSWHMGTGGTDNGAGSIVALEAMRILRRLGIQPRRTIRLALWSGEEPEFPDRNLLGSSAYVQAHKDQLTKISVYLNLDWGTGRIRGIYSQMNPAATPIFEQLLRPLSDLGVVTVREENSGGSDHVPFDRAGVPSFYFIQDLIERETKEEARKMHHTNIDTYDALILDDLKQAAVVVASTGYHLAMRDGMFPRKAQTEEVGQAETPLWKIVFDSYRDGDQEIYVMNPDGSNQHRLTNRKGNDRHPTWSPDRKRIAFASDRDGNMAIFATDPDGSNVTRLTKPADMHDAWSPEWSPDGKRILFESDRAGNIEDIYVMDAEGSNVRRLTHTPGSGKFSSDAAWSPDGKWIAFDSNRSGKQEIYVMSSDGSNVKRLTDTPGKNRVSYKPDWSPDGKRIAFSSTRDGSSDNLFETVEIYTMDADGSNVRRLTHTTDKGYTSSDPVWSPDGKKIVFLSGLGAKSRTQWLDSRQEVDFWRDQLGAKSRTQWLESREIYVMDADGSNVQRLTFNNASDGHHDW